MTHSVPTKGFLQLRPEADVQSEKWTFNSLGSEFSTLGHFHTLQLLNVPQFLCCRVVRLNTVPRGNFSHT